jgi:hypothetical protein
MGKRLVDICILLLGVGRREYNPDLQIAFEL